MNIELNITDDIIESKDQLKEFLKSLITDNLEKILTSIDSTDMSAKLGMNSNKEWDTFVTDMLNSTENAIEKNAADLLKETKVEEENPDDTTGTNESVKLSFRELLESLTQND